MTKIYSDLCKVTLCTENDCKYNIMHECFHTDGNYKLFEFIKNCFMER